MYMLCNNQLCVHLHICHSPVLVSHHHACKMQSLQMLLSLTDMHGMQEEEDDEGADEDPEMEGELTSADYRKLQSLVDEQEKAVEAGELTAASDCLPCSTQVTLPSIV